MENMVPHNNRPGRLPDPPSTFATCSLPIKKFKGSCFRIHKCVNGSLFFGKTKKNRFDAPANEYGVLYCAVDAHCAFIETFGLAEESDPSVDINSVTEAKLIETCLCVIETQRSLELVDLSGPGLANLGCDARICTGEHAIAQRWSYALWSHGEKPDGIYYRARHDPSRCSIALFDRAKDAISVTTTASLFDDKTLLQNLLDTYGFGLID